MRIAQPRPMAIAAAAALVFSAAAVSPVQAQQAAPAYSGDVVRIGVLTDMSGPYSGMGGPGSIVATRMAVEECLKAECAGMNIDVVSADHQNKADIAAATARQWLDQGGVDAMVDLTNSAASLAVQKLVRDKGSIAMFSGPATTRLTNEDCSPFGFHWMFDTYSLAAGTAAALTKMGEKNWFFITVDYAFGHSLEKDAGEVVRENGGAVSGQVRHPLNSTDFSSFLLQAQTSKAQVVALANGGADTVTAIKQAREFGVGAGKNQRLAALLLFLTDIHALGLEAAQNLSYVDGFYWDFDEGTRSFASRFEKLHKGAKPTMVQAGVYSSVRHYLKSVVAAKSDNGEAVAKKMRELPIQDEVMRNASIREDGRVIHDTYLVEVKKPSESKGAWDYVKVLSTIPAADAFQPLSKSSCPLIKR